MLLAGDFSEGAWAHSRGEGFAGVGLDLVGSRVIGSEEGVHGGVLCRGEGRGHGKFRVTDLRCFEITC